MTARASADAADSSVLGEISARRGRAFAAIAAVVLLAFAARPARAHDTWLLPTRSHVEAGGPLTLAMTSGMAFPQSETAIDADRIARSGVRLGGKDSAFAGRQEGEQSLQLTTADQPQTGLATVWIVLKPRTLELTAEDVQHYLEEIGSPPAVVARWQAMPEPRRWRESYRKNVKTFVRVGEGIDDATWAQPVGAPLELVPENDPTSLRAGDKLTFLLLRNGQPAPGIAIGLVRAGETTATNQETDARGRTTFTLDRGGWYLARVTDLRPATGKDLDWESDFATLTFEVQEAAKPLAHGSR
jgi:uncharacterized GH25 family protein